MKREKRNKTLTERIQHQVLVGWPAASASEIAKKLRASPATVSGILARLAKARRVVRVDSSMCDCPTCKSRKRHAWVYG